MSEPEATIELDPHHVAIVGPIVPAAVEDSRQRAERPVTGWIDPKALFCLPELPNWMIL